MSLQKATEEAIEERANEIIDLLSETRIRYRKENPGSDTIDGLQIDIGSLALRLAKLEVYVDSIAVLMTIE